MVVIKRSREEEPFSREKLSLSIKAANRDSGEAIDDDLIAAEFQNIVMDKDFVTTGQITAIICGLLYTKGMLKTLENYGKPKAL